MLNVHADPEGCCKIGKALFEGKLDAAASWECPKCGAVWVLDVERLADGIRYWRPEVAIAVAQVRAGQR